MSAVFACSTRDELFTFGGGMPGNSAAPPAFVGEPDAGDDAASLVSLVAYCPSNKCPAGLTTCPSSRFPCDVDLRTDRKNCGTCGLACPSNVNNPGESYECVDGRCVMTCSASSNTMDCDGVPDNGCETYNSNDNCGACGNKCAPDKPCIPKGGSLFSCGCPAGELACQEGTLRCTDPTINDMHCGACNNVCDPGSDGGALRPNTYYGCLNSKCGALKCKLGYADCDTSRENGCEASLVTKEHCGSCGNACAAGQECRLNLQGAPECMCPEGLTFCAESCTGSVCTGECKNLAEDPDNCGGCGCISGNPMTSVAACSHGSCSRLCMQGRADCNGNPEDECEIDTDHDPRNCGGCGIACDAVAGQACVRGRCVVEPCADQDAGSVEAR